MSRDTVIAIGLGCLSGACMLSLSAGGLGAVILSYLSPLPLFLAALVFGLPNGLAAAAAGSAATALLGLPMFMVYGVGIALPVLALTRQALLFRATTAPETPAATDGGTVEDGAAPPEQPRQQPTAEWYPAGLLVTWLAGLAMAGFLLASLWYASEPGGLVGHFETELRTVMSGFGSVGQTTPGDGAFDPAGAAKTVAPIIPALLAVLWQLVMAANGVLAQGLSVRFGRNARPSPDLARLRLPGFLPWVLLGVALVGLLPILPKATMLTLALILAVPFFFQGLAVVHAFVRGPLRGPLLLLFYLLLLFMGGLAVVLAALGLIEQWAELRRRYAGLARP